MGYVCREPASLGEMGDVDERTPSQNLGKCRSVGPLGLGLKFETAHSAATPLCRVPMSHMQQQWPRGEGREGVGTESGAGGGRGTGDRDREMRQEM